MTLSGLNLQSSTPPEIKRQIGGWINNGDDSGSGTITTITKLNHNKPPRILESLNTNNSLIPPIDTSGLPNPFHRPIS